MASSNISKLCSVQGCSKQAYCRTWCSAHYQRWRLHGDVFADIEVLLPRGCDPSERFWRYTEKADGCWLWKGYKTENGYGVFTINRKMVLAPRFSFYLHNGHWPVPMCLHSCDNPPCVNPAHLSEGTALDNAQDKTLRGKVSHAKLTREDVREIRRLLKTNIRQREIAAQFGVTPSQISYINVGHSWRGVV